MGRIKFFLIAAAILLTVPQTAFAHCPLCTVGAAFVAGGAAVLGVHRMVIGVFIGAFAVSTGLWFSRILKKKFVPLQKSIITIASYLLTIIPMRMILKDEHPLFISLYGDYGSLFNRTYLVDYFVVGSIIGSVVVAIAPYLSDKITSIRKGRHIPYQGIALTFLLLIITGIILQLMLHYNIIK
ncbi:hypothetical protein HYW20_05210 [Candidatus Woesearchaeota archaeon]|nr:hypothetical protein [Candidatus Woesearchaeota archaeon]